MRKKDYKGRVEKRVLSKCEGVCRTYDKLQYEYATLLNESDDVKTFTIEFLNNMTAEVREQFIKQCTMEELVEKHTMYIVRRALTALTRRDTMILGNTEGRRTQLMDDEEIWWYTENN